MSQPELFTNLALGVVTAGGTDAPAAGTVQSWTVTPAVAFPAASALGWFHAADIATASSPEIFLVTADPGGTGGPQSWTVTRGAEGTAPVTHLANFTIRQVVTAGWLASVAAAVSSAAYSQRIFAV